MQHHNSAKDFGKVAVLCGGHSSEREISLQSGAAVHASLLRQGIDAHCIDTLDSTCLFSLKKQGFDRAFIVLHGKGGEDGSVQAVLDFIALPYTGSGVAACAVAMNKHWSKRLVAAAGVAVQEDCLLSVAGDWQAIVARLGLPLAVKPNDEGSSVGVSKVQRLEDLPVAYQHAAQFSTEVLIEPWITGQEVTCAMVDGELLPSVRIQPAAAHEFYDFDAKYLDEQTRFECPAVLSDHALAAVRHASTLAFQAINVRGWGRADFILDEHDQPWFLEMNLVPGMTGHSLVPTAARAHGWDFDELTRRILTLSV